jgi:hypothetical protein
MRRGRALALSLLILAGAATWVYVRLHFVNPYGAYGAAVTRASEQPRLRTIAGSSVATVPPQGAEDAARIADAAPQSFNQRLRCTGIRFLLKRKMPPGELALLCERKPLEVLRIEAPLAQAGDPHAIDVVGWLANDGRCEFLTSAATLPGHRARMLALAQKNGATPQTVQRLDALLAEEEQGPTAEELEACRQSAEMLKKLQPGAIQQLVGVLGRSVQTLRGENELDVDIEYTRKTLMRGDADAEEILATLLLQKGTPDSQAEAMTLLEEAADSSPSAKTALARCMLEGCPAPTPDRGVARQLLVDAATAGDLLALHTLAGPAEPDGYDSYPDLPAPERYAWGRFLARLHEEGCFGAGDYSAWATTRSQRPNLTAMSPADAVTAQAQATELLGKPLEKTRALLGCE